MRADPGEVRKLLYSMVSAASMLHLAELSPHPGLSYRVGLKSPSQQS